MQIECLEKRKKLAKYLLAAGILLFLLLFLFSQCDSSSFLFVSAILSVCVLAGCLLLPRIARRFGVSGAFAFAAITVGIVFVFLFPPGSVPDEAYHFRATYWYSALFTGDLSFSNPSEYVMRDEDWEVSTSRHGAHVSLTDYQRILDDFSLTSSSKTGHIVDDIGLDFGINPPQARIPASVGITFARLTNLGSYPLFYLGRICSLLYYVLLCSLSIRVTPVGKRVFAAVGLLPMSLHLAASYSYDAGIIGLSFLYIALLLRAIYSNDAMQRGEIVQLALATVLIAPCKVIYSASVLLIFLIPSHRFEKKSDFRLFIVMIFALLFSTVLVFRLSSMLSLGSGVDGVNSHDGLTGSYYSIGDILSNPIGSILMVARTLFYMFDFYWITTIGGSLSYFQSEIAAPQYLNVSYVIILLFAIFKSTDDTAEIKTSLRVVGLFSFALVFFGTIGSMWIGWTFDTQSIIQGVQGRYFVPMLPLLLVSLCPSSIEVKRDISVPLIQVIFTLNLVYAMYILSRALMVVL